MSLRKLVLAGILGAALGAVAMQVLHAQAKPPAYLVAEIDVTDADLYKQYLDKGGPLYAQFTGRFLVRGGKIDTFLAGEPPKRSVIAVFDSLAQAQAFRDLLAIKRWCLCAIRRPNFAPISPRALPIS